MREPSDAYVDERCSSNVVGNALESKLEGMAQESKTAAVSLLLNDSQKVCGHT